MLRYFTRHGTPGRIHILLAFTQQLELVKGGIIVLQHSVSLKEGAKRAIAQHSGCARPGLGWMHTAWLLQHSTPAWPPRAELTEAQLQIMSNRYDAAYLAFVGHSRLE